MRKSAGQQRAIYNEGVNKIPGVYNTEGKIDIKTEEPIKYYDFTNLNAQARTQAMQDQFEVIEDILKKQLKCEQFEDFFSPVQSC